MCHADRSPSKTQLSAGPQQPPANKAFFLVRPLLRTVIFLLGPSGPQKGNSANFRTAWKRDRICFVLFFELGKVL